MSQKNSQTVRNELEKVNRGVSSGRELVFDPSSGELVVSGPDEPRPNPESVVVNPTVEDGWAWSS